MFSTVKIAGTTCNGKVVFFSFHGISMSIISMHSLESFIGRFSISILLKAFNLLKRGDHTDTTPKTRKALERVTWCGDICQRLAKEPSWFKLALNSEEGVFNMTLRMDLEVLGSKTCLNIIDKETPFSSACFLTT